jgi:Domain of unknown function (DUF303).
MNIYKKLTFRISFALLIMCLCTLSAEAKVKLPVLVADGMVLQREQPVKIWGTADAGESVQIQFLKNKFPVTTKGKKVKTVITTLADEQGNWSVTLPAMKAGGDFILKINEIEIKNILIGDVWLFSGQSNMELQIRRVMDMFADEVKSYENTKIRYLKVPYAYDFNSPQSDIPEAEWKVLNQENVMEYAALCYFFAKAIYEKTGVPVGIINSSWGGTPVEAWISEDGIKEFPMYLNDKRKYENDDYVSQLKQVESLGQRLWSESLYRGDVGLHEQTPWFAANYDDNDWDNVEMFSKTWGSNGLNPINGSHWFRKQVEIPQSWAGKDAILRMGCIVDADSIFVNGTFVGAISYRYPPRIYTIPAGLLKAGKNNITVRLISNGGYPSFVEDKPYKIICDKEEVSLEGEWKHRIGARMPSAPSSTGFQNKAVGLYNGMIAPLLNYTTSGVIWYQGESNVSRRNEYAALLSAMIADWRESFNSPELPFYIVELADYMADNDYGKKGWKEMQQIQGQAAEKNHNTKLIPNSDIGEWNDIHPLDKKTVGNRVAESVWETINKKQIK